MSQHQEIWKDVSGFEGYYQVSNLGRIKSLARTISRRKMGLLVLPEKILNPHIDHVGYPRLYLYKKDFKARDHVHRLVAKAFIPNPLHKPQVGHINNIPSDNRVDNLEWCTQKENIKHCSDCNRLNTTKGEDTVMAKLNEKKVKEIRRMREDGEFFKTIANKYKVSKSCVVLVVNRTNWAHVK